MLSNQVHRLGPLHFNLQLVLIVDEVLEVGVREAAILVRSLTV